MKRTNMLRNKLVYLGISVSVNSKTVVCEFCVSDYMEPKYG